MILRTLKRHLREISNLHRPDGSPNVFLFSVPRSGSTWLMELIRSQPGFKYCDEPLDLRNPLVRDHLGIADWRELYSDDALPRLQAYFQGFSDGTLRFMNPNPMRPFYRPISRRIVFKILHGCEHRMNWLRDSFHGRIVYLLRHPIPVALSREEYPRLHAFVTSEFSAHFSEKQLRFAKRTMDSGTKLERGVLSWCFQNSVPLATRSDDWVVLSYEELVINPHPTLNYLSNQLGFTKPERMFRRLAVPSAVKAKSNTETQALLSSDSKSSRPHLVDKWRKSVTKAEERHLMDILKRFDIDVYEYDNLFPVRTFVADSDTRPTHPGP